MSYRIIRFYANSNQRVIQSGLTLAEAQEHCKDIETSGSTCSDLSKRGDWFDGYEEA